MNIVLATINARYAHSSLSLRCLQANLGQFQACSRIVEFVLGVQTEVAALEILASAPRVVALSVYIWNVEELTRLAAMLKVLAPELRIVIGGPEVSHEYERQPIVTIADYLILGAAERRFAQLCRQLRDGVAPLSKVLTGDGLIEQENDLVLPYRLYSDDDIRNRYIYVEASRGCPYKCEFCLSSLDRTAVPFDQQRLLDELALLHQRGARHFKFIDRTFNLKIGDCERLLEFFLERIAQHPQERLLLHFELIPDHLPERLRRLLQRFPPASLQFEIGIQTFNPAVQSLISRRQNDLRAQQNLTWLREHTQAHLHVDLIAGLPGESLESFGAGFDRLISWRPHEIQIGILKRLRGTPIARHTKAYQLCFNPSPPYNVLSTSLIGFAQMQALGRFSRYWEMIGNSGYFEHSLALILWGAQQAAQQQTASGHSAVSPFARFWDLSEWLYARSDRTQRIAPERLYQWVGQWLSQDAGSAHLADACLDLDRRARGWQAASDRNGKSQKPDRAAATLRHQRRAVRSAAQTQGRDAQ